MLLIADSGATKTNWILANTDTQNIVGEYETIGFSPLFCTEEQVLEALRNNQALAAYAHIIDNLYFFGAGCSSEERCAKMRNIFTKFFTRANILVDHDMLGAAIALCHNNPGIACILGTGSNSVFYDGKNLYEETPALDFILGDEGSGTHLGKMIVRLYLYKRLPADLHADFAATYEVNKEIVLQKVYKEMNPKRYLASFARFAGKHEQHPFMRKLVYDCFAEFLTYHVCIYPQSSYAPVHFAGSVAHYFDEILQSAVTDKQLIMGRIIQKPIYELLNYYLKNKSAL
ncbi:MAG TPA: hypothetical protein PK239_07770 [Chitinophagales bacterium]|nr:hypothetical protein [Chitinophagales bacterium]HRK27174.1 hypothetical protein [Chitinophagales bacterium]